MKFTLNILENDERVDEVVCKLVWLPLLFMGNAGGDEEICSSCNDVEEFCLYIEWIRLIFTNCG